MGNETVGKKDREKKKQTKRREKEEKRESRKNNNDKGKSLEDMMMYLDDDGNLSATPPDPRKKKIIEASSIEIGVPKMEDRVPEDTVRNGIVKFFDQSKGYGFINDINTYDSVFVHINKLSAPLKEGDKVTFETEKTPKGLNAINVKVV